MITTKPRPRKTGKAELLREEIRKTVKGRAQKAAFDEFADAVAKLIVDFGKQDALALYLKTGALIASAKDGGKS